MRPATPPPSPQRASALLGRLWRDYVHRHKGKLGVASAMMVAEGATLGALSWMLQPMFDRVFVAGDGSAIWWVGGAILGLFVVRAVAGFVQRVLLVRVAQQTSTRMQADLVGHLMRLDSRFFAERSPGYLIERVQGDTNAVQNVWQVIIQGLGRDLVSLVSLAIVAITIDPLWTAVALVGVPLLILPSLVLQRYIRRKIGQARDIATERATRLDEIFHGIDAIKLNGMESYQHGRFQHLVGRIVRAMTKAEAGRATMPSMIDLMTGAGFFAVLLIGGREIMSGDKSLGEFMSFFTAMALAFQPLRRLGGLAGTFETAAASLERLYALIDRKPRIASPATVAPVPADTRIVFDDVSFAYDEAGVLDRTSFVAEPGKTTALVGPSGAGKSTIFNLLTRLYDPTGGRITLGGLDVAAMDLGDLRARFSVVTQDSLLFDETVAENILLGRTDVDDAKLESVLTAANVDVYLPQLPKGLKSPAGTRGANLSGGQRQRVAIARALLRDAPVLLMDEATSALDAASEAAVQSAIERLSEGRTTLVIAHRLSTIRRADKIVVMTDGRVVDTGTHAELLDRGGLYADLHKLQFRD